MTPFWPCFPFQPPFLVVFDLTTFPNFALASAVQWRSEKDEEDEEKIKEKIGEK